MKESSKIIKDIKQRNFKPVYFLVGENETFFVDKIADTIEETVLSEDEKAFNQSVLYGKDVTMDEVVASAKRFPMMAEHQVVIVREAQNLLKQIDDLISYLENPQSTTILVFVVKYKKADARKKAVKLLKKNFVFYQTKTIYDNQVPEWISQSMHSAGYTIEPKASMMLVEFLGVNLSHIQKELEKIQSICEPGTRITPEIIEENIGISKDYNNFELTKAIGMRDETKAFKIINYFAQNPKNNPLLLTTAQLYAYFQKIVKYHALKDRSKGNIAKVLGIHPFFADEYNKASTFYSLRQATQNIHHIKMIDLKGKGVGAHQIPQGDLLKELLVKIMR
ncbi:MAG: DNA polymerase III subunit delta [Psychroflexus halocasei]